MKRSKQVIHSVLESHHSQVPDNRDALLAQPRMRMDNPQAAQVRPCAHNGNSLFRNTIALHLNKFVRLVGGNDQISHSAGELLEKNQHLMHEPVTSASLARQ